LPHSPNPLPQFIAIITLYFKQELVMDIRES